jgi:hypothetical protein
VTYFGNPNGAKQLWSRWEFEIREAGKRPALAEVELNAARWLRAGFGSAGRARVVRTVFGWRVELLIEGPPAHDPSYVASVRRDFQAQFVERGFGPFASSEVRVKVLAGDVENGKARAQMVELLSPQIERIVS